LRNKRRKGWRLRSTKKLTASEKGSKILIRMSIKKLVVLKSITAISKEISPFSRTKYRSYRNTMKNREVSSSTSIKNYQIPELLMVNLQS